MKRIAITAILTIISSNSLAESSGAKWWVVNSSNSECFEVGGPAEKLDEFIGSSAEPYTNDFRDSYGALYKVEVVVPMGDGRDTVWTYYQGQALCEAEQVNAIKSLADQYR